MAAATGKKTRRRPAPLVLELPPPVDESYDDNGEVFRRGDVAIDRDGVTLQESHRPQALRYDDLIIGGSLGRGASAIVLKATHRRSSREYALKVISTFERSKREQLIREIHALYDASCESLISFYGAFYREGCITIALEYMDGGALSDALRELGAIPEPTIAHMFFQVFHGLAYLKSKKRIHRDLKPSNLLINSNGQVKLTDFGVSRALANSIAMCDTFVGTFKYMSPERIQSHQYSYSSDVWSAGLCVLECALGEYPFPEGQACIEMAQIILESQAPALSRDAFTTEFQDLVDAMLAKNPDDRPTIDALLECAWLKQHAATSVQESATRVRKWIEE